MIRFKTAVALAICFCLLPLASRADIQEEIKKIEGAMPSEARAKPAKPRKLLVFNLCKGFAHSSIPYCAKALQIMGRKTGAFEAVAGNDMAVFTDERLAAFDAVCFNNTTQLKLTLEQQSSLMNFVKGGKGVIGIHAATDNFYDWPEGAAMMGGLFDGHPWNETVTIKVDDPDHPVTAAFKGMHFEIADEIYQFKAPYSRDRLRVLLSLDTAKTNMKKGGIKRKDMDFAVSWVQNLGKGRVFYCSLGHRHDIFWNPKVLAHYLDGIQFAIGDLSAHAEPLGARDAKEEVEDDVPGLDELLAEIAHYDFGQSRIALTRTADLIRDACRSPSARKKVARKMEALLESDATYGGKQFVCRQLSLIGSEEQVPVLARLLTDEKMTDMARYALERIPGLAVDAALREALDHTSGRAKTGIINTLGHRRDPGAVKALARLLDRKDGETASAAMAALGNIGGKAAFQALIKVKDSTSGPRRLLALDACLACAEKLVKDKEDPETVSFYLQLYAPSEPDQVRIAALKGMIAAAGEKGGWVIFDILKRGDALMRTYALEVARNAPGSQIIRDLADKLPDLPAEAEVQLLAALAACGDRSVLPAVITATNSNDAGVRAAALAALGELGDASCIPLLAQRAAHGEGDESAAARESLNNLRDPEVESAIIQGIRISGPRIKVALIQSAGARNMENSASILLACTKSRDETVRLASIRMLQKVAGPDLMPELVKLLVRAGTELEQNEAAETVIAVARRIPEESHRSTAILRTLSGLKDRNMKCAVLQVLGRIGSADALPALQDALESRTPDIKAAAIQSLSEWPDDAPLFDLLETGRSAGVAKHKTAALHGAVRLIGINPDRPVHETLDLYRRTMALAEQPGDRKIVLAGVAKVGDPGALEMAMKYLREESLQDDAGRAAVKIAKAICSAYPSDVRPALDMILRTSTNEETRNRVQEVFDLMSRFEDYITAWKVSGPYTMIDKGGSEIFDVVFAPEGARDEKTAWRIMPAGTNQDRPWLMELDRIIGGENRCAYLRSSVWSPEPQDVLLELGSDDGIKVWLNRSLIHGNNASRGCTPGQDKIRTVLRKGWNELLLKITQGGGGWAACARFRAPDGGSAKDLRARVGK